MMASQSKNIRKLRLECGHEFGSGGRKRFGSMRCQVCHPVNLPKAERPRLRVVAVMFRGTDEWVTVDQARAQRAHDAQERKAAKAAAYSRALSGAVEDVADINPDVLAETWQRLNPDDRRYRPASVDPLERGKGRVSPRTAKAARRRIATLDWELDQ